jgi:hypothetical protein
MDRELETFEVAHPRSREMHEVAGEVLLSGVQMNWMTAGRAHTAALAEAAAELTT